MKDELNLFGIIFVILGWVLLYILSNRAFKRAEISKSKDKIVDVILSINDWYISISKSSSSKLYLEATLSSKLTQAELRIMQFNEYIGLEVIEPNCLSRLRGFDVIFFLNQDIDRGIYHFNEDISDVVEDIESVYLNYIKKNIFIHFWDNDKYAIVGTLLGTLIVCTFFLAAYCSSF
ncbi:MAG: hypothetical protein HRT93_11175 [Piscirickettsiaceae bacterium]|nr:hypothetical protein [Piscirickettsiaceae bacterium]